MKLGNGYKLVYVKGEGEERKLYASKQPIPTEADAELDPNLDALEDVKVLYVGSDGCFHAIKKVKKEEGVVTTEEVVTTSVTAGEDEVFVPAEPVDVADADTLKAVMADGGYAVVSGAVSGIEGPVVISKPTTINLKEEGSIEGSGGAVLQASDGGELVIKGKGKIKNTEGYCVDCGSTKRKSSGKVAIAGGSFEASTTAVQCEHGTVEISGGEFKDTTGDGQYLINCIDGNDDAKIVISGGKFTGFDPANPETHDQETYVKEGYKSENKGDYFEVVPEEE